MSTRVTPGGGRRRERLLTPLMLGVASGSILVPLNSTMLAVALPGIMDEFGLGAAAVSSLVSLYLGAVAVAMPLSGSIGDRYGHRRAFLVGVIAFGAASLVAVAADTFLLLQLARVGQAASGALVSTTSAVLIREAAPPDRHGEAFGLFDLLVSTSAAAGPFVGGLLVGAFGWRSLFVVAVPVAAVAAVTVGLWLRPRPADDATPGGELPSRTARPLDPAGLVLLAAVVIAAVVAMRPGDPLIQAIAAIAIVPILLLFVGVELRSPHPAVDPRLFLARPFSAAVTGQFGSTVVLHGSFLVVPILVERVLDASPTTSGLVLLGVFGVAAVSAPWGGRLSDRRGRRQPVVAGSLIMLGALAVLALPLGTATPLTVALLLAVLGLGIGLSGAPRQAAAFESVRVDRLGMAAGTYYTGRYLGGVVGASLGGALLASGVTPGAVSVAFAMFAAVTVGVAAASLGLPGKRPSPAEHAARAA